MNPQTDLILQAFSRFREMLNDLAENKGVTIFISSHILGEISRFATRIGIIHEGKLIEELDSVQMESLSKKRLLINANDISIWRMQLFPGWDILWKEIVTEPAGNQK